MGRLTPGAPARPCCGGLRAYDLPPDPCAPTRHYGRGVSGGYRDDHDACAQNERHGRPGPPGPAPPCWPERLVTRLADGRSLVGDDSYSGPWRGDTARGVVLALFQVVRPGRAVGEHDGQPGRAVVSPGRLGRA